MAIAFWACSAPLESAAQERTPAGAIASGNAAGTIPAWDGDAHLQAGKVIHEILSERPSIIIDSSNWTQFEDNLTEGHKFLLKNYPGYKMRVFPSRRWYRLPEEFVEATRKHSGKAQVTSKGYLSEINPGLPFLTPKTGEEVIWNHQMRWMGSSRSAVTHWIINLTADRSYTTTKIMDNYQAGPARTLPVGRDDGGALAEHFAYALERTSLAPPRLAGQVTLALESCKDIGTKRYLYTPALRRTYRAPVFGYDNYVGTDGGHFADEFDMFQGATDRYLWRIKGARELLVPYNSFELLSQNSVDSFVSPSMLNPALSRYELHRVIVVEATIKPGTSHSSARRTFYVDEDSWQIVAIDNYHRRGQLWRFLEAHSTFDAASKTMVLSPLVVYSLSNKSALIRNAILGYERPTFGVRFGPHRFDPQNLDQVASTALYDASQSEHLGAGSTETLQ
ncbi:DUF1329 domain-containing protein [Algiphilus sp.]|uniref:DUF1329 domain-containing protein n=1 Tax=Algiphilus sp. TaxID=1872431 RepID=UPI0032EF457F